MTKDEILNMPAGQDMDILVDKEVLHLSVDDWNLRFFAGRTKYSTREESSIAVLREMGKKGYLWQIMNNGNCPGDPNSVYCAFYKDGKTYSALAPMPRAICQAALLAVKGYENVIR